MDSMCVCGLISVGPVHAGRYILQEVLRKWLQAQGLITPSIVVAAIANVLNVALNYFLISRLGFAGSPLATCLSRFAQLGILLGYVCAVCFPSSICQSNCVCVDGQVRIERQCQCQCHASQFEVLSMYCIVPADARSVCASSAAFICQ